MKRLAEKRDPALLLKIDKSDKAYRVNANGFPCHKQINFNESIFELKETAGNDNESNIYYLYFKRNFQTMKTFVFREREVNIYTINK